MAHDNLNLLLQGKNIEMDLDQSIIQKQDLNLDLFLKDTGI